MMTTEAEINDQQKVSLNPFFARHFFYNFSNGVISPYISVYAVQLGASSTEMGWLRALMNLFSNVPQIPWGVVSDRLGRYAPAIIFGGIFSAILWLPLLLVVNPFQYIIVVTLQAFATSAVTPAWASLIGRVIPKSKRGLLTSYIDISAALGSIGATLLSGYIMTIISGELSTMYSWPIILSSITGVSSSLILIRIHEEKKQTKSRSLMNWSLLTKNPNFKTLCTVSSIHSFFMSLSWPLFSITTVRIVQANMMEIAYISIISSVASIFVRRLIGRITDKAGRRQLLVIGRVSIFVYPALYAVATNVSHLFLATLLGGIFGAVSEIVLFAYQLDITSPEQRGASFATYNTVIGLATFFGSLAGGYLPTILSSNGVSELLSIQITYLISTLGRIGGGILFMKLKEPSIYPSSVRNEITRVVSEDFVRTRDQLKYIESRGEQIDDELQNDFDWIMGLTKKKENK